MNSATTESSRGSSPAVSISPLAVPTLEALEAMTSEPESRAVIRDVDWSFYERLVDSIPEGANLHADFDGRDLEIMSLSPLHNGIKKRIGRLVELIAEELEIACTGLGQTTWTRPEVARGLESDECYYFSLDKLEAVSLAMKRMSPDLAEYPNPDLAIEVDLSPSKIDRPGIYAALGVLEVWRFDNGRIVIERLGPNATYESVHDSIFLPVQAKEIGRWVLDEDNGDGSLWARQLRAWVRVELAPERVR